ncbi:PepSY-associated TM helix domain-containing protein [Methylobacterium soli]|uniref:Peptidase n=1 Tax=Methylobacterium soli TaxID=553447 RepID=A0A6L3T0P1_9HYPH|nr:PepSY-associated TM helix domain-containing protein [Methylobacterium soli]KAB1078551.1 hypothetical protein F6X53_14220 [Methylobacterium soli]GJE44381.1 hypothetical protein AEGHOMDF_3569 [Methylobacterium soli]
MSGTALATRQSLDAAAEPRRRARARRAFWLKQLHTWHWVSSGLCLVGMLLFTVTGFTLNHAGLFEGRPQVSTREAVLPRDLAGTLAALPANGQGRLPDGLRDWLAATFGIATGGREAEFSKTEILVSLPRPGGDAFVSIGRPDGAVLYERTGRGWVSYLNDLHKGRNAGPAWGLFIDVFAGACLVFCLTGLVLLQIHAGRRPATWPVVGLGLLAPLLIALLLIHA